MVARTLCLVVLTLGCNDNEAVIDFADMNLAEMTISSGTYMTWGQLLPHRRAGEPCPVMNDDFTVHTGDLAWSVDPGGFTEDCSVADGDCRGQGRCDLPYFEIDDADVPSAVLSIGDTTREITCDLGDSLAARTATRVDAPTWDVAPGDNVTIRVSPASDLTRFTAEVRIAVPFTPPVTVSHTIDGDTLTFHMPGTFAAGPQSLYVLYRGDDHLDCSGVPTNLFHEYTLEQTLTVH